MKAITIIASLILSTFAHADEKVAVKASSGRFKVVQEYHGNFVEAVRFLSPELPLVKLPGFAYPGKYDISPDEHWLLRMQKTGSGDSIAILYRIEDNGRVSQVIGFNDLLWRVSDMTSRLKRPELYHTGVKSVTWMEGNDALKIVLRGSNATKSGDGIEVELAYDLKNNKAIVKKTSEQVVAPDGE